MTINDYLARYKTKNYFVTVDEETTKYLLVNRHTMVAELESPMLPQVVANQLNFEDTLSEFDDLKPDSKEKLANVIQFKPKEEELEDVDDT